MSRKVKPLQVSSVIKSSRYISFICGVVYGMMKLSALRAYEATAKPRRDKFFAEKNMLEKTEDKKRTQSELVAMVDEMNLPDVTPGWESDIQ